MSKNLELAKDYFERHEISDECYVTADGRVFHNSGSAISFAETLSDKEVERFTRVQVEKQSEPLVDDFQKFKEAVIKLNAFDTETATYEDAKALVKELGLETATQSKVDLFAAIVSEQNKIKE